jgi:hypothetical protein
MKNPWEAGAFGMIETVKVTKETVREFTSLGAPTLIVAGPALTLLRQWDAELIVLRRRSPTSDAVTTLSNCLRELSEAINAGRDTRLHRTIGEAHATSGIPVSTLRWLCKHKADLIGAQKHEGIWYIEWATFERYLRGADREIPISGQASMRSDSVEAA